MLGMAVTPLAALDPGRAITQYRAETWGLEEGLPQMSVEVIRQTRDGYLWLGTQEGLARFDGVRFQVVDRHNVAELRSNLFTSLAEDAAGTLWAGTTAGLLSLDGAGGHRLLTTVDGLGSNEIQALLADAAGNLWVGHLDGGLSQLRDGKVVAVYQAAEGLPPGHVWDLATTSDGSLWIATSDGLGRWQDGRLSTLTTADGLPDNLVSALCAGGDGSLWIGTGGGLAQWRGGVITAVPGIGDSGAVIQSLVEDHDGNLWVGTTGTGLMRRTARGEIATLHAADGVVGGLIRAVYEDREGGLWVGSGGRGLARLMDGAFTTYTRREGLSRDQVLAVLEDHRGSLWVGLLGGGLNRIRAGQVTAFTRADGLASDTVWALAEDRHGDLWLGTYGSGLQRWHDGRFTTYSLAGGAASNFVRAILEDREGTLWVGTGNSLQRLRGGVLEPAGGGLGEVGIYSLHQDHAGDLWVGTDGKGLVRYRDGVATYFTRGEGLGADSVYSFHEDERGVLWIGTEGGGLGRYQDGALVAITARDGLFDDTAYQILDDGLGFLWMSCNRGIYRVSRAELDGVADGSLSAVRSQVFGTADGLASREANGGSQPAGWRGRDGRLWFPTTAGLSSLDPAHLAAVTPLVPSVIVETVHSDGQLLTGSGRLQVPAGTRKLEIDYTAPSFVRPEGIRFRYFLEGFDSGWTDAGSRRTAIYTGVGPGRYRFRVIARRHDSGWSSEEAGVEVQVAPSWWQTWWFRSGALLSFGLVLGAAHQLRTRTIQRRAARLEHTVARRTAELKEQAAQLAAANEEIQLANREVQRFVYLVSHDLRGPVLNIEGFLHELRSGFDVVRRQVEPVLSEPDVGNRQELREALAEDIPEALSFIEASARHMDRMTRAMLKLARLGAGRLELARIDLAELVDEVALGLGAQIRNSGAHLEIGPLPEVVADHASLERIFDNLLSNALKYLDPARPGLIQVSAEQSDRETVIHVRDNGVGISLEDIPKVFEPFRRLGGVESVGEGVGLFYVQALVRRHRGRIECRSVPGEGTVFTFTLPRQAAPEPPEGSE